MSFIYPPIYIGASASTPGIPGLVPAPGAGNQLKFLRGDGTWTTNAGGDVFGPGSSTDNAIARYDLTTGKILQDSVVLIGDTGAVTGVTNLTASGLLTLSSTSGTSAGGLLYGTDIALWREGAGALNLQRPTAGTIFLQFYSSSTRLGYVGSQTTEMDVGSVANIPLVLFANNANVLTLGTDLSATFAGAGTFSGVLAIGNTVAAGIGVASTHKVTMSVGGSTYYLLASNV